MQIFPRLGLYILSTALIFGSLSCKKDDVSTVDQMVGTYDMQARVVSGLGSISATTFEIRKKSGSVVEVIMDLDSTDLPIQSATYTVNNLDLTEISPDSIAIVPPSVSNSVKLLYKRTSTGKLSGSYMNIDGSFVSGSLNGTSINFPISFKLIGVKRR